ncbi:hypothetical protein GCM10008933_28950 [Paenibacillus motobuensis]|uniref:Uncharacterized protein n=1 Tax=Paenibacillus motobuensis TaxID=295324 RepID=A0ABN0YIB4_9BACL
MMADDFRHIQISLFESLLSMGSGDVMRIVHGYAKIIYNRNSWRGGVIHNPGIKANFVHGFLRLRGAIECYSRMKEV